ncbi:MAG: Gfo/Idh/MocA family oxidoreductase [bacterium]|nr:Gfo/Idh/MocA family oxidoreductase [bacterium]
MIKIGIVGFGYWGPKLFRSFQSLEETEFSWICDKDSAKAKEVSEVYHLPFFTDLKQALQEPPDILIVSSPPSDHCKAASQAFMAGCHVLLEKPAVMSMDELKALTYLSEKRKLCFGIDHTFLFSPFVRAIKQIIASGELGDILLFDSERLNFGPFRRDVSALHDLAVHDISIALYVLGSRIKTISACGRADVAGEPENAVQIKAISKSGAEINVRADWLYPVKKRRLFIKGTEAMLLWDEEGLRIFSKNVRPAEDFHIPLNIVDNGSRHIEVPDEEPLKIMAREFLDHVMNGKPFVSDLFFSIDIIEAFDAAWLSMREGGCLAVVNPDTLMPRHRRNISEPPCP